MRERQLREAPEVSEVADARGVLAVERVERRKEPPPFSARGISIGAGRRTKDEGLRVDCSHRDM